MVSSVIQEKPHGQSIPRSDRIPFAEKIAFSAGVNTDALSVQLMMGIMWMPFFNIGMGMSPVTLGVILMLLRTFDGVADPFVGNFSDNLRTRWGRRKPLMIPGIVAAACIFPLFWFVPNLSELGKSAYLLGVGILFFLAHSFWSISYYGMQLELTPNYDERTRLTFWMVLFGGLGAFVSGWVLPWTTSSIFADPITGKPDIVSGMRSVCWVVVAIFLVAGLVPALFVRERFGGKCETSRPKEKLWDSLKESANCRPLWTLIGTSCFLTFGSIAVGTLWQYANIYYVFNGDLGASSTLSGWRSTATVVTALGMAPIWVALAERLDKVRVLIIMMSMMVLSHLLDLVLMRSDMPFLQLITGGAEAAGSAGFWMILPSMKADVADYDELQTGRRREGSLNAFYSWFLKVGSTAALGSSGVLLQWTGFTATVAQQPESVLRAMRYLYIFVPIVFWLISIGLASLYRLDRKRMGRIRAILEKRRGHIPVAT